MYKPVIPAIISLCLLFASPIFAQSYLFQNINIAEHAGGTFELECMVNVQGNDKASGSLLVAVTTDGTKQLKNYTGKADEDFPKNQWVKLTLSGKIDKAATKLLVGALYDGKAKFYYDDFKLQIDHQPVTIKNSDFEDSTLRSWYFTNPMKNETSGISNSIAHSGQHALYIDRSAVVKSAYGDNEAVGKYADVNGIKIYYEVYGKGAPLLLLHGGGQSIGAFVKQIPALTEHYQVIAVDTRAHGKSTVDTTRLTYDLFAEDMSAFIRQLKLGKVNILGWSDGANTGLILAIKHPDQVNKLAAMAGVLFNDSTVVSNEINNMLRAQIAALEKQPSKTARESNSLRHLYLLRDEPHVDPSALKRIQCPVLVMAGEKDIIKQAHTELIARNISRSQLVIFKGATHYAPHEVAEEFNKTVINFLQGK